ncbi:MAG: pilus assembly protein [Intrasporangium sp.]|nr:pilus assembly protein [Intrasporangium sp.]
MVAALLLFVVLAVLQLGIALYVRNTLIAAASEGARFGARADVSPADGAARAASLITSALNESFASEVSAVTTTTPEGIRVVVVNVVAPLPLLGPIGPAGGLTVHGRAFSEEQVSAPTRVTAP